MMTHRSVNYCAIKKEVQKVNHKFLGEALNKLLRTCAVRAVHHRGYKYLEGFNHKMCLKWE